MILITGTHTVGKTTYAKTIASCFNLPYVTASSLLEKKGGVSSTIIKSEALNSNQKKLADAIDALSFGKEKIIIDGHICLATNQGILRVPFQIFRDLRISDIIVLTASKTQLQHNGVLRQQDQSEINLNIQIQNAEIQYARYIAKSTNINVHFLQNNYYSENSEILLPIKPVYAERIWGGEKKFEYRKIITNNYVRKIYLYETSPKKKVTGEIEVLARVKLNKEKLWKITKDKSGISLEEYSAYFQKSEEACAYCLGKCLKYDSPLLLSDIGIKSFPQSFLYVNRPTHRVNIVDL